MQNRQAYQGNPYLFLLRTAWKYAQADRGRYVLIYACFMVSNIVSSLYPVIWGIFINDIQQNGLEIWRHAWIYGLLYIAIRLGDWAFHGPSRVVEMELAFHMSRNFMAELYHKSLRLPVHWHQDHHSGATINRIRKAQEALRNFFSRGYEYLHTFFKFAFSFVAMIYFSPLFGGVALILGALVVVIILRFDKPYIRTLDEVNEKEHIVSSTLFDSLSNVVTVITLRLQQRMEKTLLKRVWDIFPSYRRNIRINEWKWFVTDMLVGIIYVIILLGYIWQNNQPGQVFMLGGLVTLAGYVERFASVFHNVAYLYTDVVRDATDVGTALVIPAAYEKLHLPDSGSRMPVDWSEIRIRKLGFQYERHKTLDETDHGVLGAGLMDLDICLQRGKKIALIGESGSGKSTLLAILRGLYPPQPGVQVEVDGRPFSDGLAPISELVTLFPQEPEIFENTIEYNITLGLPHSEEEIMEICSAVRFQEVVAQLPRGLQSHIVEKGVNLSGGQKQRLALARGLLAARDSDIILLDEPTSNVDPKTESMIYDQIFKECREKIVVSALHRLHLLPRFDWIYVMDQGKIVAEGNFSQLKTDSAIFRALWEHQERSLMPDENRRPDGD